MSTNRRCYAAKNPTNRFCAHSVRSWNFVTEISWQPCNVSIAQQEIITDSDFRVIPFKCVLGNWEKIIWIPPYIIFFS